MHRLRKQPHERLIDKALELWNPIFRNPALVGGVFRATNRHHGGAIFARIKCVNRDGPESLIALSQIVAYDAAGNKTPFGGVVEVRPVEKSGRFDDAPAELARLSGLSQAYEVRPFRNGSCRVVTPPEVDMVLDFVPRGVSNFYKLSKKLDPAEVAA